LKTHRGWTITSISDHGHGRICAISTRWITWYVLLPANRYPLADGRRWVKALIRHFLMKPLAFNTPDSTMYY
jgi:hypothetical protein